VTHSIPDYLKLHIEETPVLADFPTAAPDLLTTLSDALLQATGWSMQYLDHPDPTSSNAEETLDLSETQAAIIPVLDTVQQPIGQFVIHPGKSQQTGPAATTLTAAKQLASAIGGLISMLEQSRETVWKQEAELATGIPVTVRKDEETHLAARLESILRCGAEAVGCQAAAAYLLDDDTSYLKLRSCWGLPKQRLLDPPRPLQGASTDLEALVGHAVILKDPSCLPDWLSGENVQAAVCVPISSPTVPLGTLWILSDTARSFDHHESNLVEMVAGRISAELEREVLLHQQVGVHQQERQWQHAMEWQENRLPKNPPLSNNWKIAAATHQAEHIGGDFYDWNLLADDSLAVVVGDACGSTIESALTATTVQASLRAQTDLLRQPGELLNHINRLLWTGCTGDQFASLFAAAIDQSTGKLQYTAVGEVGGILLRPTTARWLTANPLALGTQETSDYETVVEQLAAGDTLVLFSEGLLAGHRQHDTKAIQEALVAFLRQLKDVPADEMVDALIQWGQTPDQSLSAEDHTVLVVQRAG
jgi:serine phosphatase RsbU (regulator of sigma subunit)